VIELPELKDINISVHPVRLLSVAPDGDIFQIFRPELELTRPVLYIPCSEAEILQIPKYFS
jgi:hypothetical protein